VDTLLTSLILKHVLDLVIHLMKRYMKFKRPNLFGLRLQNWKASQFHHRNIDRLFTKHNLLDREKPNKGMKMDFEKLVLFKTPHARRSD
jgi:hypothetical protein